jgi:hypothetical protein
MIPGLQDDLLDHKRMLARERASRYRSRKASRVTGVILDDNGKPNSTLQRVARNIAHGMTNNQALIQAGASPDARVLITKAQKGLAELLKEKQLTVGTIIDSTIESVNATSPMLTAEGSIDRPDWSARAAGRRDAIALLDRAGELPQASQASGSGNVTLVLQSLNVTLTPQDVATDSQFTSLAASQDTQAIDITPSEG